MTSTPQPFQRIPNPAPASEQRRAEILSDPGFGRFFTDHMVTIKWTTDEGWHDARVEPYGPLTREELATFLQARGGMTQGWTGSLDKLEAHLLNATPPAATAP